MLTANDLRRLAAHYSNPDHKIRVYGMLYKQFSPADSTSNTPELQQLHHGEMFINPHPDEDGAFRLWTGNGDDLDPSFLPDKAAHRVGLVNDLDGYQFPFVVWLYLSHEECLEATIEDYRRANQPKAKKDVPCNPFPTGEHMISSNEMHRLATHYSNPDHKMKLHGIIYQETGKQLNHLRSLTDPQLGEVYTGQMFVNPHPDQEGLLQVWPVSEDEAQPGGLDRSPYLVGMVDEPNSYQHPCKFIGRFYFTGEELHAAIIAEHQRANTRLNPVVTGEMISSNQLSQRLSRPPAGEPLRAYATVYHNPALGVGAIGLSNDDIDFSLLFQDVYSGEVLVSANSPTSALALELTQLEYADSTLLPENSPHRKSLRITAGMIDDPRSYRRPLIVCLYETKEDMLFAYQRDNQRAKEVMLHKVAAQMTNVPLYLEGESGLRHTTTTEQAAEENLSDQLLQATASALGGLNIQGDAPTTLRIGDGPAYNLEALRQGATASEAAQASAPDILQLQQLREDVRHAQDQVIERIRSGQLTLNDANIGTELYDLQQSLVKLNASITAAGEQQLQGTSWAASRGYEEDGFRPTGAARPVREQQPVSRRPDRNVVYGENDDFLVLPRDEDAAPADAPWQTWPGNTPSQQSPLMDMAPPAGQPVEPVVAEEEIAPISLKDKLRPPVRERPEVKRGDRVYVYTASNNLTQRPSSKIMFWDTNPDAGAGPAPVSVRWLTDDTLTVRDQSGEKHELDLHASPYVFWVKAPR